MALLLLWVVFVALSRGAVTQDPCDSGQCQTLWSINPGDMSFDNHGGAVTCNPSQEVSWNGNELTISYGGSKNTCYARSKMIGQLVSTIPDHGMVSAMIKVTNKSCDPTTIWPAFWLVGTGHSSWPGCGEIDMAERQGGTTQTHIIGADGGGNPFSPGNMVTWGHFPGDALQPDGQYRKYGFEWNYRAKPGKVDLTVWFEGSTMGTWTCGQTGSSGQDLSCSINYNAVKQGFHEIVFDVDTHGPGSDQYSMSIKDAKIQAISSLVEWV